MAENSVDDQYSACTGEMSCLVNNKYLEQELKNTTNFQKAWQLGENFTICDNPGNNLTRNHCIALHAYSLDTPEIQIFSAFNDATRAGRVNYTDMTYQWYSLHFLLTDAVQRLNKIQKLCNVTYRGTNRQFRKNVTNTKIRFGSFTSSSLNSTVAQKIGNVSCFVIRTCHGAHIEKYSNFSEQEEVLIPPYETFQVIRVLNRTADPNFRCGTVYMLNSTGIRSNLQCELVKQTKFSRNQQCTSGQTLIHYRHQFIWTVLLSSLSFLIFS